MKNRCNACRDRTLQSNAKQRFMQTLQYIIEKVQVILEERELAESREGQLTVPTWTSVVWTQVVFPTKRSEFSLKSLGLKLNGWQGWTGADK